MNYIYSIILGIVEGVTEFLPISSTGHMILTADILRLPASEFWKSFEVFIQLGAIFAVVVLYAKKVFTSWDLIKKIIVAFLPTAFLGLMFYKIVKTFLLGNSAVVLWSLFIGGLILIIFEHWHKDSGEAGAPITYKQAFVIGLFQSLAMIPGVSRSAATIVGGLALGINRKNIVEFSFLLAVPTMLAATGLDLIKTGANFSGAEWGYLAVGFITSFLVAILAVKFFLAYIQKHSFAVFGYYRVVLAIAMYFWLFLR